MSSNDGSNIEANLDVTGGSELGKPNRGESSNASLLLPTNRALRATELRAGTSLDFAKHDDVGSPQNQIDFARLAAPIASDEGIATLQVPAQRFVLAEATARLRGKRLF